MALDPALNVHDMFMVTDSGCQPWAEITYQQDDGSSRKGFFRINGCCMCGSPHSWVTITGTFGKRRY